MGERAMKDIALTDRHVLTRLDAIGWSNWQSEQQARLVYRLRLWDSTWLLEITQLEPNGLGVDLTNVQFVLSVQADGDSAPNVVMNREANLGTSITTANNVIDIYRKANPEPPSKPVPDYAPSDATLDELRARFRQPDDR